MLDILLQHLRSSGGPVLVVLIGMSLAAATVAIFKTIEFGRLAVGRSRRLEDALGYWARGNTRAAIQAAEDVGSPAARATAVAMSVLAHEPERVEYAREAAAHVALQDFTQLGRHLRLLEAVSQAAPMLGLLGTVIGMIEAFGELSAEGGAIDPSALAEGIWVALVTTAAGLSVAIPAYFLSMWFEARLDYERAMTETSVARALHGRGAGDTREAPVSADPTALGHAAISPAE
jgi:biopolymer transport protein ExbB